MFKKRRDYSYYSSYNSGHKSRLRVGRVVIAAIVAVALIVGLLVFLNLSRIKLLVKGYSFSQVKSYLYQKMKKKKFYPIQKWTILLIGSKNLLKLLYMMSMKGILG